MFLNSCRWRGRVYSALQIAVSGIAHDRDVGAELRRRQRPGRVVEQVAAGLDLRTSSFQVSGFIATIRSTPPRRPRQPSSTTRTSYHVGRPWMFDGKMFRAATGTPMFSTAFANSPFARRRAGAVDVGELDDEIVDARDGFIQCPRGADSARGMADWRGCPRSIARRQPALARLPHWWAADAVSVGSFRSPQPLPLRHDGTLRHRSDADLAGVRHGEQELLHVPGAGRAALGAQPAVQADVLVLGHDAAGLERHPTRRGPAPGSAPARAAAAAAPPPRRSSVKVMQSIGQMSTQASHSMHSLSLNTVCTSQLRQRCVSAYASFASKPSSTSTRMLASAITLSLSGTLWRFSGVIALS